MRLAIFRALSSTRTVWIASAVSLVIGLFFVYVWAPHPWGWRGIDQYHQLAVALSRGESFGTTDVPWAYAYYVGTLYALFGERAWIPVLIQVIANASVPWLLYQLAAPLAGKRVAVLAALLVGVFSFNTVYASTQSSDALCTIAFLAAFLLLARAHRTGRTWWFAAAGLLAGVVPQFRPNLILLPAVAAAAIVIVAPGRRRALGNAALYLAMTAVALAPWTVRNYQLTGTFLPTSSHGGVQLWYGSLQTGEYLEGRPHNPRSLFETPAFDYFSLADQAIEVSASLRGCAPGTPASVTLQYWTDRNPAPRRVSGAARPDGSYVFELPGQPLPTAVYYAFETAWTTPSGDTTIVPTPSGGAQTPLVYFVSGDHLGDLDRHGDLLDIFDIVVLLRHLAWREPLEEPADLDADGTVDDRDLRMAVAALLPKLADDPVLTVSDRTATLALPDGSTLAVPRSFERITDLEIAGPLAGLLSYARLPRWAVATAGTDRATSCLQLEDIRVNGAFYRREPHLMRRYTALALDNIQRAPAAFLAASAYRAARLFVIRGTSDQMTAQQFQSSRLVYAAGTLLSVTYLVVFIAGVLISLRRRSPVLVFLIPILYVPATIAFVLTNMRYTITVQPLMFVFVAVAVLAIWDRAGSALAHNGTVVA